MNVRPDERGAALLSVLLLVAVMATVAATALDRIGVGTRLAANVATVGQGRAWLAMAETLTATRLEDLLASEGAGAGLASDVLGVERSMTLPDGGVIRARVEDGGNCFNLNSLVEERNGAVRIARPFAAQQFTTLMTSLGIAEGQAIRIAASSTDYIDSDGNPLPSGAEDGSHAGGGMSSNQMMADASELRVVAGVGDREYSLLRPWVCALPSTDLSPINVNTLRPEQAPLLAMLAPDKLDLARARAQLAGRPAGGFSSVLQFWQSPALAGVQPPAESAEQVQLTTSYFVLHARVASSDIEIAETALIDATARPARVVRRRWDAAG